MIDLSKYLKKYQPLIESEEIQLKLNNFGVLLESIKASHGRLLLFGNGAAASIASHAALDFTKQGKLTSLCFHDAALLTAYANDYGYENAHKEIIKNHYQKGDLCIFISVSGESPNIVRAAEYCDSQNYPTVSFSGRKKDNALSKLTQESFWVDSEACNIVENVHSIWLLSMVDYLIGKDVYEVS